MPLKIIIVDLNSDLLSMWNKVFQAYPEIRFENIDFKTLVNLPDINAVLMRGIFAYERYGGVPKLGESQIISTNGEKGMPPWIVTTATFSQDKMPEKEYDYTEFCQVFKSIDQFNNTNQKFKINTLGFDISFLYGFRSTDPYKNEAESLRKAYSNSQGC